MTNQIGSLNAVCTSSLLAVFLPQGLDGEQGPQGMKGGMGPSGRMGRPGKEVGVVYFCIREQ